MADLRQQRKSFVAISVALAAVAALAALYLVVPLGASNAELNSDLKQITKELDIKEKQAAPLRGLPDKLVATSQDITKFYRERLPERQSDVSEELGKLASAEGVQLSDVKYENFDTDVSMLRAVVVEAQLAGEYSHIAKFINAVERDKMFLIVDGLSLDDQKAGAVRLQLRFGTCLRPPGIASAPASISTEDNATDSDNSPAEKKVMPVSKSPKPPISKPMVRGMKHP